TAQVAAPNGGGYVKGPNPYFVSFMGDAPKKNPKVIVYAGMSLAQKNDQEAYELGDSKAFKPIMENTLKYLNVGKSKDDTSNADYSKVPDGEGQDKQRANDNVCTRS
ncbi:penicillin-binding transpeptidase domain-containing protein, partial [Escherichia coli]|uniref:penicillin-binding transpeptidase domain-containing protein n=1 Tax=Escherichia coli TaxID=562 RepID=UPI0018EF307A